MRRPRRAALDARFAFLAAACLILAELAGSFVITRQMLERELRRSHQAAVAQTELVALLAGPGLWAEQGPPMDAALVPIAIRNPAMIAARFERTDGFTLDWLRDGARLPGAWWQAAPREVPVISSAVTDSDGAFLGEVSVAWDQRPIHAEANSQFRTAAALSVTASLALAGLGLVLIRRRLQRFRVAEEATRDLAMKDPLTGIRNRRGLTEAIETGSFAEAWDSGTPMLLALADLDGFKPVNDTYGHGAGDELLRQIALRLDREVDRRGIVARLGGDEFAMLIMLDPADPGGAAENEATRLMGVVRVPFVIHPDGAEGDGPSVSVRVGLSLGLALAPDDAQDASELMRRADAALYRAKAEGRGRFRRFVPEMDPRLGKRRGAMRLEAELREAMAGDLLTCHYQPIRELGTRALVGFEALARWPHPTRGFVPPSEFIPIAEANGLIAPLTDLLLTIACREAAAWPEPMMLSFNLSPLHLGERELAQRILRILAETGLPPGRLQLEMTEGALLGDLTRGRAMLSDLKAMGVRLALDDFGTGHSGLRELQALPFDVIKIDSGFVRAMASDLGARKIVAAIIGLGESLGLPIVAEGIEEEVDIDFLGRLGCDMGQGWLLGRPVPAAQLAPLLPGPDADIAQRLSAA